MSFLLKYFSDIANIPIELVIILYGSSERQQNS